MASLPQRTKSFTTEYKGISRVLANKIKISLAYDPLGGTARPKKEEFLAIWDTGATNCAITPNVVQACDLKTHGVTWVNTAKGKKLTNKYMINVFLPNDVEVPNINATEADLPPGSDVLVGMDIMNQGDFAVSNLNGNTVFSFRMPSVEKADFNVQAPPKRPPQLSTIRQPSRNEMCPCGSGRKYKNCCGK